jgi:steroid delta-isomerase
MIIERRFQAYRTCLESLTAGTIDALDAHLSDDVHFRDPFHDARGREAIKGAIARLFAAAKDVSFSIDDHAVVSNRIFFHWRLSAVLRGKDWQVEGVTKVAFDEAGKVSSHEEYWDAASQLYERLPVIGSLLRYLRRRIAGP